MANKPQKTNIDRMRESALSMTVGDESDGPITGMISVADVDLYVIKSHAVYRAFLADEIDPKRTNASIPNGHQRISRAGSESTVVARSFLTANVLFNGNQFNRPANRQAIMNLSLAVMNELLAAQKIENELLNAEEEALANFEQPKHRSVALPSVENLNGNIKAFVQKIEHAAQAVFQVTQQFYDHKDRMWDGFTLKAQELYGEEDDLSKFAEAIAKFMIFIRNLRHCIEHPKDGQRVIVKDFVLTPSGKLITPTIQVVHSRTPQQEMELNSFLPEMSNELLAVFETLMVHLAAKHISPFGGFEKAVGFLSDDQIDGDSKVRVSYFIRLNEEWQKLN